MYMLEGDVIVLYVPYDTVFMVHTTLRTLITVDILTVSLTTDYQQCDRQH